MATHKMSFKMRWHTCALLQRRRMASTGGRGSTSCSIFTQLRRIIAASDVEVAMTMPGQSRSFMCLSKCTSWRHLKITRTHKPNKKKTQPGKQLPVYLLGHTRSGSNVTRSSPLQAVDQTTLSHIRKTYKTAVTNIYFTLETKLAWCFTGFGPYLQHLQWWQSLCLGCGSSFPVASLNSLHRHKHCCWGALWWPVLLEHYCVSSHNRGQRKNCLMLCQTVLLHTLKYLRWVMSISKQILNFIPSFCSVAE